jgi:hypothetical protein
VIVIFIAVAVLVTSVDRFAKRSVTLFALTVWGDPSITWVGIAALSDVSAILIVSPASKPVSGTATDPLEFGEIDGTVTLIGALRTNRVTPLAARPCGPPLINPLISPFPRNERD